MCPLSPRTSHWNPTLCQVALKAARSQLCWTARPKTTIRWQLGYSSKRGCQLPCLHLIPNATLQESSLLMSFFRGLLRWHAIQRSIPVNFAYTYIWITWVLTCVTGAAQFSEYAQIASKQHGSPHLANSVPATQPIGAESAFKTPFCRRKVLSCPHSSYSWV